MKLFRRAILTVLIAFTFWAIGLTAFSDHALKAPIDAPETKTDVIIVLTGGNNRIEEGFELFKQGAAPLLFITGVHKNVSLHELMKNWKNPDKLELALDKITLGYKARSTFQNAEEVKEWIEGKNIKSARLVTGNYHMPRAALELRTAIPEITFYLHPVEQPDLKKNEELLRNLLISEYHKFIYRSLITRLNSLGA
ncbi:MAG: hypothetical protein CBB87_03825 [Micavibrio sp. TMED27]|nr:hypothetical protein [Micavibrio sp.]OUT91951.1 MAG: hypothetical protein CBB87_03825 [Micavibrio sp. TMED27]|tara:strand:- start:2640 stop:3227 length:588 start_codon:yes stop_codon:yes gene_type:complete